MNAGAILARNSPFTNPGSLRQPRVLTYDITLIRDMLKECRVSGVAMCRAAAIAFCVFVVAGSALAQDTGAERMSRSVLALAFPGFQQTDQSLNQLLADGFELKSVSDNSSGTLFALQRRSTVAICIVAGLSGTVCVLSLDPAAAAEKAAQRRESASKPSDRRPPEWVREEIERASENGW